MPKFDIYQLEGALSATRLFSQNEEHENYEHDQGTLNNIQGRTLLLTFMHMGSTKKIDLLTTMFQLVRNLRTIANILNIFSSVNTKLISYSKIFIDSNSLYEQFVQDDDRMLDFDILEETLLDATEWFENLNDADQVNIITSLMRLAGGSIIKKLYVRLIKIFNKRSAEGLKEFKEYKSDTSMLFLNRFDEKPIKISNYEQKYIYQDDESDYNPHCSTSKKVVEARKQWQVSMAKLRKEIETDLQKLNEPILQRIKEQQTASEPEGTNSKTKKDGSEGKTTINNKIRDMDLDWVQFLPIWNVKKIFSYLDEATLHNLKNVNNYWAAISKEVIAEKKTREYLDSVIKKSEEFLQNLLGIPQNASELETQKYTPITETTGYRKRIEKQRRTGTLIKRRKEKSTNNQNKALISECFKEFDTRRISFLANLKTFPTRTESRLEYDKSISASISDLIALEAIQNKFGTQGNFDLEEKGSITSGMSQVPSIVVSIHNMETW